MIKRVTNFVLNKLQKKIHSLYRTNEGGITIRNTRFKKFRKKGKKLIFAAQIVAIWYLLILTGSFLTTDTGAYFNDVEKISGTISTAEDYCKDVKNGSDFWQKYCKDNSGGGNGPDAPDTNTGEGTDPDNPGHNPGGCDDHTNAPCSDPSKDDGVNKQPENVRHLIGSRNENSANITLSWKNPLGISYVRIYINGQPNLIEDNVKGENIKLTSEGEVTYRITTVDSSKNESAGETVTVK